MTGRSALLDALGGEAGCKRFSTAFYARVATDPVLRPLFPGKSLKCAIEEFSAFLIQLLGGDEAQTQRRWWLSLRESHARFNIGPPERAAWLKHMTATIEAVPLCAGARQSLMQFFNCTSAYVAEQGSAAPADRELASRWADQRTLDDTIAAIVGSRDDEATALAAKFRSRSVVFTGLLARMAESRRPALIAFVLESIAQTPSLVSDRFGGRTLLHYACGAGCVPVVEALLRAGADPDVQDSGSHTPLYRVANECGSEVGPELVRLLVTAGADVNACDGVTRATPLHMAARRGFVDVARALLDCGALIDARDAKGVRPIERARSCRKPAVIELLLRRGA